MSLRVEGKRKGRLLALTLALLSVQAFAPAIAAGGASAPDWAASYSKGQAELTEQQLDKAEDNFRKALHLAESAGNSGGTEQCLRKLADTLILRDKTADAQALYERLLTLLSKKYGGDSAQIAPVLMALGSIQEAAGDHTTAMTYYQRALRINEKNFGPYSPAVAGNLQRLGRATFKSGNKAGAEKHYKRSLDILNMDPGLSASNQLESLNRDYGDLMKNDEHSNRDLMKDFQTDILQNNGVATPAKGSSSSTNSSPSAGASHSSGLSPSKIPTPAKSPNSSSSDKSVGGSAWQQQTRIQFDQAAQSETSEAPNVILRGIQEPASDQALGPAYNVINNSIFKQDHYEKGESYYQRMVATDLDALGPNHPTVANDLNGLARLYVSEQKYSQAEPLLQRAMGIYEKVYGSNTSLTVQTKVALAGVEFHLGNADKAAEFYRSALSSGQSALGPNSIETARILNDLAFLYYHQGKLQESKTFYEMALTSTEGAVGQENPLLAACLRDYAQVLRGLGQLNEANAADSRADKILAAAKL